MKKYRVIEKQTWYDKVTEQWTTTTERVLGETVAVSKEKAISNVRYRVYGKRNPEGEEEIDYACGGIYTELIAEEI